LKLAVTAKPDSQGDSTKIDQLLNSLIPHQIYPANTVLYEQDSLAQEVYFIREGLVKLHKVFSNGKEFIVDLRFIGWLLGASSVIIQKPNPVAAVTLTKCRLHRIPATTFLDLLTHNADFAWYFIRMQSCESFIGIERIVQLGCLSAQQRLEQLLWQLLFASPPATLQKEVQLQLLLKHREISQLVAVTPQHLSRVFKDMQKQGLIRLEKGWIIILDPQKLYHQDR
jgi:CRP-like cAMP-binding protein